MQTLDDEGCGCTPATLVDLGASSFGPAEVDRGPEDEKRIRRLDGVRVLGLALMSISAVIATYLVFSIFDASAEMLVGLYADFSA